MPGRSLEVPTFFLQPSFFTYHPRWLVCFCSHSFRANREAHVGLILLPYVRVLFAVNMAVPTFFLRPHFLFLSCFAYIGCGQGVFGLHVEAMSAQCIQQLLCRRVVSASRRETYHNVDFASQWFIPSAGRIASQASLLNMTSHVCGHLHHWKAVSTLRWCNRTPAACLRALVFNCLRPDDASMCE